MEDGYEITTKFNDDIIQITSEGKGCFKKDLENYAISVINLKDEAVKQALIKLGWTPPREKTVYELDSDRESRQDALCQESVTEGWCNSECGDCER